MKILHHKKLFILSIVFCGLLTSVSLLPQQANAVSNSDFNPANIIDVSVFFNPGTMNAGDIQNFLNAKVPVCKAGYTCLKDYTQGVPSKAPDAYCSGGIGSATKTAAQIIFDASQACGINPKVLIVLLQKEQGLVTDDWPVEAQYRSATGFGCPDTAACDANYYGFFNQVYNAARQFQRYVKQPQNFNFAAGRTSNIQYNPQASCGSSPVTIQNSSTAALYNYTPYQPNAATLAAPPGQTVPCGAYGNLNFWRYFNNWFGSTQTNTPYAWSLNSFSIYANAAKTQTFSSNTTVAPGGKVYVRVVATNFGNQTWDQSFLRLGTARPYQRTSQFYDSTWYNPTRPAQMTESSVSPGSTATFDFVLTAPQATGTYQEYFNLVAEDKTWLNDPGASIIVSVVSPVAAPNAYRTNLPSEGVMKPNEYLLSPDGQSAFVLQTDGNLVLYGNFRAIWNSGTAGKAADRAVMQPDGNFVIYFKDGTNWSSGTFGHTGARLEMQTDGNVVIYNSSNSAVWSTGTLHLPNHLSYVNTTLSGALFTRQQLETADRRYRLALQADGNLVLYSTNRALWSSGTFGQPSKYLYMQPDGNLVIYGENGKALWNTQTNGRGASQLMIQQDGNLVIYGPGGHSSWSSGTFGQF